MAIMDTVADTIATRPAGRPRQAAEPDGTRSLAEIIASLGVETDSAWRNYKRVVSDLCRQLNAKRLIEIGAGRSPLFDPDEVGELGVEITVNDISAGELARLAPGYKAACFDVAGDISSAVHMRNSFDLAYSRMVFEHVADGRRAWTNLYDLMAPGGVAFAFIPTLYSIPFVLNWLLPDETAAALVRKFRPDRDYDKAPVFPARYSWCYAADTSMTSMLSAIGYRESAALPFYGHSYYGVFPVVRDLHKWFTGLARRRDWRTIASFAYILARK